ncbi:hypothetical protein Y1Q_0022419 [Alligator mississippiensis]|uniref:Uncharacterized protein n=1 Tax=Alligator mississippiensis TaxID=8496 RepID=A0A151N0A6_ALLMI|nr:hypothetical protein Y1Q_0022419 [Alligator mississippiensis]
MVRDARGRVLCQERLSGETSQLVSFKGAGVSCMKYCNKEDYLKALQVLHSGHPFHFHGEGVSNHWTTPLRSLLSVLNVAHIGISNHSVM